MPDIQLERENRCGETTAALFKFSCVNRGILGQQTEACKNELARIQQKTAGLIAQTSKLDGAVQ